MIGFLSYVDCQLFVTALIVFDPSVVPFNAISRLSGHLETLLGIVLNVEIMF